LHKTDGSPYSLLRFGKKPLNRAGGIPCRGKPIPPPPRKLSRSPSMKNIYWGAGAIDEIRLIRNYIPALPFASPTYAVSCFYLINA
jgi:hypothetical protein